MSEVKNAYCESFDALIAQALESGYDKQALSDETLTIFTQRSDPRHMYDDFYLRDRFDVNPMSVGVAIKHVTRERSLESLEKLERLLMSKQYAITKLDGMSLIVGAMYSVPLTLLYATHNSDLLERVVYSIQANNGDTYVEACLIRSGIGEDLKNYFSDNVVQLIEMHAKDIGQYMEKNIAEQYKLVLTCGKTRNGKQLDSFDRGDMIGACDVLKELISVL